MPSHSPTVINNTVPFLQVSSTDVSYDEIKESYAANSYQVNKIYLAAPDNISQIQQSYTYQHFDSNGNQIYENLIFPIDPYQKQATIFQGEKGKNVVFDGRSSMAFQVQPLTAMKMTFFYQRVNTSSLLNTISKTPSNFVQVEREMNDFNFFEGLTDIIPDM
jgi:hypothetical protein